MYFALYLYDKLGICPASSDIYESGLKSHISQKNKLLSNFNT